MHSHHQARDEHEEDGEVAQETVDISVTGVQGGRADSETRPKNMRVVYIMRVF